jgi:hypothetical protein
VAQYVTNQQLNVVHPLHDSSEALLVKRLKKKLKTLKSDNAKQKVLNEIQETKAIIEADRQTGPRAYSPELFPLVSRCIESPEQHRHEVNSEQRTEEIPCDGTEYNEYTGCRPEGVTS